MVTAFPTFGKPIMQAGNEYALTLRTEQSGQRGHLGHAYLRVLGGGRAVGSARSAWPLLHGTDTKRTVR